MSGKKDISRGKDKTELYWIAKRFIDLHKDIEELNYEDRLLVIKRISDLKPASLFDILALLNQYINSYLYKEVNNKKHDKDFSKLKKELRGDDEPIFCGSLDDDEPM